MVNSIIFNNNYNREKLEYIIQNSFDLSTFGYKTSNSLKKGRKGNVFFKKLDVNKIKQLYGGDYIKLFYKYYNLISKIIKTNNIIGIINYEEYLYEFSNYIDESKLLDNGNKFEWEELYKLFCFILEEINICVKYNAKNLNKIGFETAIWNFSIDGTLFDLDPPKILLNNEDSSFTRKDDINHCKRTIYRSFTEIGMKVNLLITLILGQRHNSFSIKNLPKDYLEILLNSIFESITSKELKEKLISEIKYGVNKDNMFINHPVELLRREYMIYNESKNKTIIFVAGTSESGKSGGINYLKEKYPNVQHIKIRDVFPKIYEDVSTTMSFEEWQQFEENRDLNNFWKLFVNKVYELASPDKSIIILDTMYGINGMMELYKILGNQVKLLYIDAPFNDRVKREYLRLRTDSKTSLRKADMSITLEEIAERTKQKDEKKNKMGANLLKYLKYSEDCTEIFVSDSGNVFPYIIDNNGTLEEFYAQLDCFLINILEQQENLKRR